MEQKNFVLNMDILRKRQRFSDHDDLTLLREVLGNNPFVDPNAWNVIQENLCSVTGKQFSTRTLKDHLDRLIRSWLQEYKILRNKSGIEVTETEKDLLCHNIYLLMNESKAQKPKRNKSSNLVKQKGVEARTKWALLQSTNSDNGETETSIGHAINHDNADVIEVIEEGEAEMQTSHIEYIDMDASFPNIANDKAQMQQSNETPKMKRDMDELPGPGPSQGFRIAGPVKSKSRKINSQRQGLKYLEKYDQEQLEIKKGEMDLEKRRLSLEERKCALAERQCALKEYETKKKCELEEKKLEIEIENTKTLHQIIERQEKIINFLINKS
ncbi:uncharacterized protein LOC126889568 [Diabrotica virgifera virgifera]|uniref:Uncharacterized protein n=1 Tax=Diabrotica virgifera virgifera TaxID=50390 RepID=A0ABM5KUP1_DIAVI|nr:uncharacterized protein LOC126889568 [Diabrotica virgifera virgifera]